MSKQHLLRQSELLAVVACMATGCCQITARSLHDCVNLNDVDARIDALAAHHRIRADQAEARKRGVLRDWEQVGRGQLKLSEFNEKVDYYLSEEK